MGDDEQLQRRAEALTAYFPTVDSAERKRRWRVFPSLWSVMILLATVALTLGGYLSLNSGDDTASVDSGAGKPENSALSPPAAGGKAADIPVGAGAAGSVDGTETGDSRVKGDSQGKTVVVHVVGQVKKPGVFTLSAGARLQQAVAAAGGFTARADPAAVNLARVVQDGEQLYIPARGQFPLGARPGGGVNDTASGGAGRAGNAGGTGNTGGTAAGSDQRINLNTASAGQLESISGIGPATAKKIIDYRESHGPFHSVEQVTQVPGIGEKTLQKIRERLRVN